MGRSDPLPPPEVKEVHTGNDKVRRTGRQPSCILFHLCVVVYHSQRSICAFLSVYICAYTHRQTRPYTYFLPTSLHIRATGDDSEPLHPGPEELLFLQRVFGLNSHIKIMIIINKFLPCSSSCKPPKSRGMFCHKSFISVSFSQKRRKQYLDCENPNNAALFVFIIEKKK